MTVEVVNFLDKEVWLEHISKAQQIEDSLLNGEVLEDINLENFAAEITRGLEMATDADWEFFKSLEFSRHDEEYLLCQDCHEVKILYKMSYMFGDSKRWKLFNCLECILTNTIRRVCYDHDLLHFAYQNVVINYLAYFLLKQNKYDQAHSTRELCNVCNKYVSYTTDTIPESYPNHWARVLENYHIYTDAQSQKDPTQFVVTHTKCMQRCQWGNHTVALRFRDPNDGSYFRDNLFQWRSNGRDLPLYNSQTICGHCFNTNEEFTDKDDYDICGCDRIEHRDNLYWSDIRDSLLCDSCYSCSIECDDCGNEYYEDESHECEFGDDEESSPWIHSYGFKPKPTFFGEGNCFLGIELEVEMKDADIDEAAEYVHNAVGNRAYLKYDGSLQCGFEIVSHPHSLTEIQYQFPWKILSELVRMGVRSWDTRSCGIHVHISKKAFSDDAHQIRFTKLIYDNQRQVQRIAGRASSYASFSDKGNVIRKVKNHNQSEGRYSAVNVEPPQTIEVRVFKGSLRKERVLSALEFVHAVYIYTKNLKMVPKDKPLSWVKFVGFVSQNSQTYPNLFTIINESFDKDSITEQEEE